MCLFECRVCLVNAKEMTRKAVAVCHRCEGDQVAVLDTSCCDWSSCKVSICLDFWTEEIKLLTGLTEPS